METITRIGHPLSPPSVDNKPKSMDGEVKLVSSSANPIAPPLFAMPTKPNYHSSTGFVHCSVTHIEKDKYHMSFQAEDAETVSIIAVKVKHSRTANYHLFDALRGGMNNKLLKKSGHYIGKLRRPKNQPVGCYTLYNSSREKEQVAAYLYDIPKVVQQISEGQPPRKMQAVIPKDAQSLTVKMVCSWNICTMGHGIITVYYRCRHAIQHSRMGIID